MNKQQLLADLATGIGSSECHSLFNLEPFGCARRLWYSKTNHPEDFPWTGNKDTERGTCLEPLISGMVADKLKILPMYDPQAVRHPVFDFLLCHLDRTYYKDWGVECILEIKAPNARSFLKIKREGLPESWLMQVQHQMLVTGLHHATVAVMCADAWELLTIDVERDLEIGNEILVTAQRFWQQVENGPPPERLLPTDKRCKTCPYRTTCQGEALLAVARQEAEKEGGGDLPQDDTLAPLVNDYLEAKALAVEACEMMELTKARLTAAIGDRQAVAAPGAKIYYRTVTQFRIDTKAAEKEFPEIRKFERKSVFRSLKVYEV